MEALEIEDQADQEPLARGSHFAAQRELAEAEHVRDDTQHGLDGIFARHNRKTYAWWDGLETCLQGSIKSL
jgi:hypothetical protein